MQDNKDHKAMLKKIRDAHKRCESANTSKAKARQDLANAIREASQAGIRYREITEIIGIGKTGISSILSRSK
jgi:DNA-binding transcriptional regulator YhcF (GntR family)